MFIKVHEYGKETVTIVNINFVQKIYDYPNIGTVLNFGGEEMIVKESLSEIMKMINAR